ncbi:unnamed protein product, partial [Bubo scandiacus]
MSLLPLSAALLCNTEALTKNNTKKRTGCCSGEAANGDRCSPAPRGQGHQPSAQTALDPPRHGLAKDQVI